MSEENTSTGVVKWFNNSKGYGFINIDGTETDVFVHYSAIVGDGYRTLNEGDRVQFVISEGQKGKEAREVQRI
jgi:CspA family cold shock protein